MGTLFDQHVVLCLFSPPPHAVHATCRKEPEKAPLTGPAHTDAPKGKFDGYDAPDAPVSTSGLFLWLYCTPINTVCAALLSALCWFVDAVRVSHKRELLAEGFKSNAEYCVWFHI
jgi:hypothetical protein